MGVGYGTACGYKGTGAGNTTDMVSYCWGKGEACGNNKWGDGRADGRGEGDGSGDG